MYADLIGILKDNGYYLIAELKNLSNSSCTHSTTTVLDFLSIKEKIYAAVQKNSPASVKGIFVSESNKLYLIQTENYYPGSGRTAQGLHKEYFDSELDAKINGTLDTLSEIVSLHNSGQDLATFLASKTRDKIKTIIIADIPAKKYLEMTLGELDKLYSADKIVGDKVLMTCSEFESKINS